MGGKEGGREGERDGKMLRRDAHVVGNCNANGIRKRREDPIRHGAVPARTYRLVSVYETD